MKKNTTNIIFLVLLAGVIAFFSLSYIFVPAKSFSEDENRVLQTSPRFSFEKLLDGTYTSQLHNYFSDQINMRSQMVEFKAFFELALGKNENNNVLLGRDGYLIETHPYTETNYKYLKNNLYKIEKLISKIEENGVSATSLIVPRKIDVLHDKFPPYYSPERNDKVWDSIGNKHVSLLDSLLNAQNSSIEVYYKTDHHLTCDGAYEVYEELSNLLGFVPRSKHTFEIATLSNDFYGTSYSKSGFFFAKPDTLCSPTVSDRYETTIVELGITFNGILDRDYLEKKDKYSVFLSGNNAHVKIVDTEDSSKETLLIIKDSFSHAIAPFLLYHYNVELIDPRYYIGSIEDYIVENEIENVVFLFGLDTLASANLSIK